MSCVLLFTFCLELCFNICHNRTGRERDDWIDCHLIEKCQYSHYTPLIPVGITDENQTEEIIAGND